MLRIFTFATACAFATAAVAQSAPRTRTADSPETSAGASDKVICKRFPKTGSLADTYRTCKTKREWERERDNLRQINWSSPCKQAETGNCE